MLTGTYGPPLNALPPAMLAQMQRFAAEGGAARFVGKHLASFTCPNSRARALTNVSRRWRAGLMICCVFMGSIGGSGRRGRWPEEWPSGSGANGEYRWRPDQTASKSPCTPGIVGLVLWSCLASWSWHWKSSWKSSIGMHKQRRKRSTSLSTPSGSRHPSQIRPPVPPGPDVGKNLKFARELRGWGREMLDVELLVFGLGRSDLRNMFLAAYATLTQTFRVSMLVKVKSQDDLMGAMAAGVEGIAGLAAALRCLAGDVFRRQDRWKHGRKALRLNIKVTAAHYAWRFVPPLVACATSDLGGQRPGARRKHGPTADEDRPRGRGGGNCEQGNKYREHNEH